MNTDRLSRGPRAAAEAQLFDLPFLHPDQGLAQWQEFGRDQGHTVTGVGQMGAICEMAWTQGEDLYGYDGNRFMMAAQYVARYNLGQDVPFTTYTRGTGTNGARPRAHRRLRRGPRPGTSRGTCSITTTPAAGACPSPTSPPWPTGAGRRCGGGDCGPDSGGFDQLGFGTLLYVK